MSDQRLAEACCAGGPAGARGLSRALGVAKPKGGATFAGERGYIWVDKISARLPRIALMTPKEARKARACRRSGSSTSHPCCEQFAYWGVRTSGQGSGPDAARKEVPACLA